MRYTSSYKKTTAGTSAAATKIMLSLLFQRGFRWYCLVILLFSMVVVLSAEGLVATASTSSLRLSGSTTRDVDQSGKTTGLRDTNNYHWLRRNVKTTPSNNSSSNSSYVQEYELWEPHEITETVQKWAEHYPNLIRVTTAQEAYGLPAAGGPNDCPFDESVVGCLNQILLLQDFLAHPEGSESSNRLPEILWSGEVHGNEQVGPTAVLEAAQLLLDAATCEALPRIALKQSSTTQIKGGRANEAWLMELERAQSCRQNLAARGIDDGHRRWLARLMTTRRIVIVPTANALGYYQKVREENNIDPNRDFPYDQTDPKMCMQTIAGRTLNEVFREHMFQLSLTFHGGMEVIGYEWGAPHWMGKTSPDDTAQSDIATAYSQFAGGWKKTSPYDHGPYVHYLSSVAPACFIQHVGLLRFTRSFSLFLSLYLLLIYSMNDLVYPVNGGMEDWAYAASWDKDRVVNCAPVTYGGYPLEKTSYEDSTLRVFNMLVETSNAKIPPKSDLGSSLDLMTSSAEGNGHVARNIRLALLAAELVEPYVVICTVNELDLSDDLVPLINRSGRTACQATKTVAVPHNSRKVVVQWTVGGALTVDQTFLYFAKWDANLEAVLGCDGQPATNENLIAMRKALVAATPIGATAGTTQFSKKGASPPFAATFDISKFRAGDKIAVVAAARVDQDWGKKLNGVQPDLPPQSHVVNARTNPDWHRQTDGKIIQGRLDWYSVPLTLVLKVYDEDESGNARVEAEELSLRFNESQFAATSSARLKNSSTSSGGVDSGDSSSNTMFALASVVAAGVLVVVGGRTYLRHEMRKSHRERVREFIQDENAVSPGLQQIAVVMQTKNGGNSKNNVRKGYTDISSVEEGENDGGLELV